MHKVETLSLTVGEVQPTTTRSRLLQRKLVWRLYSVGLIVFTLVSINFFIPGSSIKCVQCNSLKMPSCSESPPPARACEKDMQFCSTTKEMLSNGSILSTSRECVSSDRGSSCDDIDASPNPNGITKCHWTCKTDGCNGTKLWQISTQVLVVALAVIYNVWNQWDWSSLFLLVVTCWCVSPLSALFCNSEHSNMDVAKRVKGEFNS